MTFGAQAQSVRGLYSAISSTRLLDFTTFFRVWLLRLLFHRANVFWTLTRIDEKHRSLHYSRRIETDCSPDALSKV